MKNYKPLLNRRNALLAELNEQSCLVAGSFFERDVAGISRHCLSRMVKGKQRQLYISAQQTKAVTEGIRQHRKALDIIRKISEINIELIKKGVNLNDV
jgi:hypothetical protein